MALQACCMRSIFMRDSWGLASFKCLIIITFYYLAYKQILLEMAELNFFSGGWGWRHGLCMPIYTTPERNIFTWYNNSNCMLRQALKRLTHHPTLPVWQLWQLHFRSVPEQARKTYRDARCAAKCRRLSNDFSVTVIIFQGLVFQSGIFLLENFTSWRDTDLHGTRFAGARSPSHSVLRTDGPQIAA